MPREPWRVGSRCRFGYPSSIVSPSLLDEGTPFPSWAWLTCPWLSERVATLESHGEVKRWAAALAEDAGLAGRLARADRAFREARASEGEGGHCSTGIAGLDDADHVKCLHAHVAVALAGIADPIGEAVMAQTGRACEDVRCDRLIASLDEG